MATRTYNTPRPTPRPKPDWGRRGTQPKGSAGPKPRPNGKVVASKPNGTVVASKSDKTVVSGG